MISSHLALLTGSSPPPPQTLVATFAQVQDVLSSTVAWLVFAAIVVLGLLVYGLKDVSRLSLKRAWAISSVSFSESLRRRVLWVTPLAMLGVIIVSQLTKPVDEQDAIRQTTKFAIFATGLVVVMTTIILACTNLPREIENRVIYTVVTKPTTRLEIVLGKVIGFARVSATILLIMGVFTWGYLKLRAWNMERDIGRRLAADEVPELLKPTLTHYREAGLLSAKRLAYADNLEFFARAPEAGVERRWFSGTSEQEVLVPFELSREMLVPPGAGEEAEPGSAGLIVLAHVGHEQTKGGEAEAVDEEAEPTSMPYMGPFIVPPEKRGGQRKQEENRPRVIINILDSNFFAIPNATVSAGQPLPVVDPTGKQPVQGVITPESAQRIIETVSRDPRIYLQIVGTGTGNYSVGPDPITLIVPGPQPGTGNAISSARDEQDPAKAQPVVFRGRSGTYGQQLRGSKPDAAPVAVYRFTDAHVGATDDQGRVPMEIRVGIERSGDEVEEDEDVPTVLAVSVHNRDSGARSDAVTVTPESGRPAFFSVPQDALAGGNFDVQIRNFTPGHFTGLQTTSLAMVIDQQPFAWNLFKSLTVLWLMSILVTAVAIFCSTFLSWPIAVVLTLVILLGHWGVMQLGDTTAPGIGNTIATDIFGSSAPNAAKMRAVSASVEALSRGLNLVAAVLPDISRYSALEDIERGITVSPARLRDAAVVTFGFGIPLVVLAYVFLKNKEVAP